MTSVTFTLELGREFSSLCPIGHSVLAISSRAGISSSGRSEMLVTPAGASTDMRGREDCHRLKALHRRLVDVAHVTTSREREGIVSPF